jgi:hypothetical protein
MSIEMLPEGEENWRLSRRPGSAPARREQNLVDTTRTAVLAINMELPPVQNSDPLAAGMIMPVYAFSTHVCWFLVKQVSSLALILADLSNGGSGQVPSAWRTSRRVAL